MISDISQKKSGTEVLTYTAIQFKVEDVVIDDEDVVIDDEDVVIDDDVADRDWELGLAQGFA